MAGKKLETRKFEELGEALSLGTERAAVLAGGKVLVARSQDKLVSHFTRHGFQPASPAEGGASWFFEGTTPRPLLPLGLER